MSTEQVIFHNKRIILVLPLLKVNNTKSSTRGHTSAIGHYIWFNVDLDMERKQKRWKCWLTGNVPSAEAFAIAVSACKC